MAGGVLGSPGQLESTPVPALGPKMLTSGRAGERGSECDKTLLSVPPSLAREFVKTFVENAYAE